MSIAGLEMLSFHLVEGLASFTPNAFWLNRWRISDYRRSARGKARASRNKRVPSPVHAPYPLR